MKPIAEIPNDLEVATQCQYSVPASGVPFFMVQYPTENGSLFQFRKGSFLLLRQSTSFDTEPVSTVMTIEEVEKLIQLMKEQTEHQRKLSFDGTLNEQYILTESGDECFLFFQLIQKYFYPICENWKSVHNMQRLQNKRNRTESEIEAESTTDSNE